MQQSSGGSYREKSVKYSTYHLMVDVPVKAT